MEEVGRVHEGSVDAAGGWGQQVTLMVKKSSESGVHQTCLKVLTRER